MKKWFVITTALLLILVVSACGTAPTPPPTPVPTQVPSPAAPAATKPSATAAPTTVPVQPTTAPAQPTAAPTKAAAKVTLTLWHWETPPARVDGMNKLFAKFATETGITVEQVPINQADYQTKMLAAISANQLPDMMFINPPNLPLLMQAKAIIPADDLFASLNKQYTFPTAVSDPYKVGTSQYAIPIYGVYWPLTYRKDLYDKAGLKPPETWQELRTAAEKLHSPPDMYGFCLPVSSNGNYGSQVVWSFVRANGGDIVKVENGKETVIFNSPANVKTYATLADLAKFSPPGKENMDWTATELLIKSGKCATVMYNGAWIGELADKNPDLLAKYSMALMPGPEKGKIAHTGYPRAIVLTNTAKTHMDAVTQFMEWLYKPANHAQLLVVEPGLFMPVTQATASSDAFLAQPLIAKIKPLVQAQADAAKTIQIIGFTGKESAPHASQIESSFTLGKVLQKIVLEGMTPENAVAWGESQYKDIIAK